MSENDDVNVSLKVTADTSALKQAIKDFDGTEQSVNKLKDATASLKTDIDAQTKAIGALNQANRVQNYELLQGIRVLRSVVSVARDLNQVYQTLILRNLDSTALTVKQKEAYEDAITTTERYVRTLDTFGEKNDDVTALFKELINQADNLSSTQLKDLIERYQSLGEKAEFTASEQQKFNEGLQKLRDLLKETDLKESQKKFEDFFGGFTTAALAAGSLGTFALNLGKYRTELTAMIGLISKFAPEIGIILALLGGKEFAEATGILQYAGSPEDEKIQKATNPSTGKPYDLTRDEQGIVRDQGNYTSVKIDMQNVSLNSDLDLQKLAALTADEIQRRRSLIHK